MKCTIQLVLDDIGQIKVNHLRKLVDPTQINSSIVNHISIADIDIEEEKLPRIQTIINQFADSHPPIKLTFNSLGIFTTSDNVLFLSPVITEQLLKYKNDLSDQLNTIGIDCGTYYTKENWQPHCTIGLRISNSELLNGLESVKNLDVFPMEINIDKIDLSRYDPLPFLEIFTSDLSKDNYLQS